MVLHVMCTQARTIIHMQIAIHRCTVAKCACMCTITEVIVITFIYYNSETELPATEMETDTSNGELEQEPDDSLASLKERMAKLMYQNQWDQVLNYKCPTGSAVYRVQSVHNNAKEDRLWQFTCKRVNPNQCQQPRCTTSSYINNFRDYISFMCGRNQYMAGVYSYHDNGKEDRRWRFTCCSLPSYISRECYLTGYVNGYDGAMNFNAGGNGFITGVVSEYSTGHR